MELTLATWHDEYGRKKMKSMVLFFVIAFMFLAVEAAYGMGGGGSHGDGRTYSLPQTVSSDGSSSNGNAETGQLGSNGCTGGSSTGSTAGLAGPGTLLTVTVPEPMGLLLLGTGTIGLIGLRRKFRKHWR
jgi:hypothetical protein